MLNKQKSSSLWSGMWRIAVVGLTVLVASAPPVYAQSSTTCDDANPFDGNDDTAALQSCFDNYDIVYLHSYNEPGYAGYIISDTIIVTRPGILITGVNFHNAWIIAASSMPKDRRMLALNTNNFLVRFVELNGNRAGRGAVVTCPGPGDPGAINASISDASGFTLEWFGSYSAVCGSGLIIQGTSSNYLVHDSIFYDNGQSPTDGTSWADGLTVFSCPDATIRDSYFWENTDVSFGINGAPTCSAYRNHISNYSRYGFAGLVLGDPSTSGGDFSVNDVAAGTGLFSFGIIVGVTPWIPFATVSDVAVYNNSSDGAVITLAVDRLSGGAVYNNSYSNNGGSHPFGGGCGTTAAYTVGTLSNGASVQGGYISRTYDSCSLY